MNQSHNQSIRRKDKAKTGGDKYHKNMGGSMNREQATKAVLKFEQSIRATQVFCLLDGTIISRVSRSIYDETLAEMESALNGQREELIRLMSEQEEVNAC